MRRTYRRAILASLTLLCLAAVLAGAAIRRSLPLEEGVRLVPGLSAPVEIEFDALAVPRIRAADRNDAFVALGYVTAQNRLFQLDMMRRRTSGRLAEIFGPKLIAGDRWSRSMGFEQVAQAIFADLPPEQRRALEAYAIGVNRAMEQMRSFPLEFYALRYRPEPWRPHDSLLVLLGMETALTYGESLERAATVMQRVLPSKLFAFLTPESDCYNERLAPGHVARCGGEGIPFEDLQNVLRASGARRASGIVEEKPVSLGSNGWVVAPGKTRDGRAIMANDMHLRLGIPNIWYRAEIGYGNVRLAGLTLPGLPMVITGSNGHVAWGFTAVEGDFSDLVRIEPDPEDPTKYRTPEGSRPFGARRETILVRGAAAETVELRETIWGPVLPDRLLGDEVALHWTALDSRTTNLDLMEMDRVADVEEATGLLRHAGGPQLNALLSDRLGNIAWTLMGRIPKRVGMDGLVSESWADGRRGWSGYLTADETPRLVNPPSGFLVNANQRMLPAREFVTPLGHSFGGGYRAWRVAERLRELSDITEKDMLALQLDTATEFYRFYQKLALDALDASGNDRDPGVKALRGYIASWDGRADTASTGLPLIIELRKQLIDEIFSPIVAACKKADPNFRYSWTGVDDLLQQIAESRRPELLPLEEGDRDWTRFIRARVLRSAENLMKRHGAASIAELDWGKVSKVRMGHPLSGGAPLLSAFLDMPPSPLAGCADCVRFAYADIGANARMVVAPGHEGEGLLQLAAGQSGHPGSPHYADQHATWLSGAESPFLAGERRSRMILEPSR